MRAHLFATLVVVVALMVMVHPVVAHPTGQASDAAPLTTVSANELHGVGAVENASVRIGTAAGETYKPTVERRTALLDDMRRRAAAAEMKKNSTKAGLSGGAVVIPSPFTGSAVEGQEAPPVETATNVEAPALPSFDDLIFQ